MIDFEIVRHYSNLLGLLPFQTTYYFLYLLYLTLRYQTLSKMSHIRSNKTLLVVVLIGKYLQLKVSTGKLQKYVLSFERAIA